MSPEFEVLDLSTKLSLQKWLDYWNKWPDREIFAHPNYLQLNVNSNENPICFILNSNNGKVILPLFIRELSQEPYFPKSSIKSYDLVTPYGYGGPFYWDSENPKKLAEEFWMNYEEWIQSNNIVSEFIRFTLSKDMVLPYPGEKIKKYSNIFVDLTQDKDIIWKNFEHKVRKNINKANRNAIEVIVDAKGKYLNDFLSIYYSTMDRRNADKDYYFSKNYFMYLNKNLSNQYAYFHALKDNNVISTELVLISHNNIYSFLGGTDQNSFSLRPNDLIKYKIILWAKEKKISRFILGGGYQPDDGIFRFKRSFSPNGVVSFYVGKRIHNQDFYDKLIKNKKKYIESTGEKWNPDPEYFPLYRA